MISTLAAATDDGIQWTVGMQHTALFLGIIVSLFAILAGVRAWKKDRAETIKSREEAIIARSKQEDLLKDIANEFKPNHGSSLVDRITVIGKSVEDHHVKADKWFSENNAAHEKIHRRIDQVVLSLTQNEKNAVERDAHER
jgi:hypothetical protein